MSPLSCLRRVDLSRNRTGRHAKLLDLRCCGRITLQSLASASKMESCRRCRKRKRTRAERWRLLGSESQKKAIQGHDFATSRLRSRRTALCKKFIWESTIKARCTSSPVHHRCAGNITRFESDLRDLFGIVNTNDDDDEGDTGAVIGVVVDETTKSPFKYLEEKSPECNAQVMQHLIKSPIFQMKRCCPWLCNDADQSGALDHDPCVDTDLVASGGAHVTELMDLRRGGPPRRSHGHRPRRVDLLGT